MCVILSRPLLLATSHQVQAIPWTFDRSPSKSPSKSQLIADENEAITTRNCEVRNVYTKTNSDRPNRTRGVLRNLVAIGLFSSAAMSSGNAAGKLSADLGGVAQAAKVDVIVRFTSLPSVADVAAVEQQGGKLKAKYTHIP